MRRRELGAGVSVMWVIFLIVLLLGATGFIYSVQGELTAARSAREAAEKQLSEFQVSLEGAKQAHVDLSNLVGFRDAASTSVVSANAAVTSKLEAVRGRFPNDILSEDKTLESVIDRLVAVAERLDRSAQEANTSFQSEVASRTSAESSKNEIKSTMEGQLTSVQGELRDARETATRQQTQADTKVGELQTQVDELNNSVRAKEAEATAKAAELERKLSEKEGRIRDLANKVKLVGVDDHPWDPDGTVVAASTNGLVYLDLGSKDLLRGGVKFDVFRFGKGGNLVPKGLVEVRQVESDHAVAGIVTQLNDLDPIAAGDVVANPHFSKQREKIFALVGEFPVLGRNFIETRLKDLGAEVAPGVTSKVDFVVVGEKDTAEDSPEVADLPEYKTAQELGIQMLRISDLDRFLKP